MGTSVRSQLGIIYTTAIQSILRRHIFATWVLCIIYLTAIQGIGDSDGGDAYPSFSLIATHQRHALARTALLHLMHRHGHTLRRIHLLLLLLPPLLRHLPLLHAIRARVKLRWSSTATGSTKVHRRSRLVSLM